jgi:hypothetical protein
MYSDIVRVEAETFAVWLDGFLVLSLLGVHIAKVAVGGDVSRVAGDPLLIGLSSFLQFPGDVFIITSADKHLLLLAGMFPQLKCFAVVFAGTS